MPEEVKTPSDPQLLRDTCSATIAMAAKLIQLVNSMSRFGDVADVPLSGHIAGIGNFLEAIIGAMDESDCFLEEPVPDWINTVRTQVRNRLAYAKPRATDN